MSSKREKGSMTIEAALFLVFFLAAFLTIINIGRLVQAEMIMQHAINNTAMQISKYGYILTKTGIAGELVGTSNEAKKFKSDVNEVTSAVVEFSDAVDGMNSGEITEEDVNKVINAASNAQGAVNIVKGYFKEPKGLLTGLLAVGKEGVERKVCSLIVARIAEGQVESYFENITDDPDGYLEDLGIVGGMDGLDFSDSTLLADGTKDINIIVRFKVKNNMFPIFDFGEYDMCLSASTRIW